MIVLRVLTIYTAVSVVVSPVIGLWLRLAARDLQPIVVPSGVR